MRKILKIFLETIKKILAVLSRFASSPYTLEKGTSALKVNAFFKLFTPYSTGYKLIRIGSLGDGGYLVPDDLDGISDCFSPGVGMTCRFENDLALKFNIKSWLIDDTVSSPDELHTLNDFKPLRLGLESIPQVSVTLDNWVAKEVSVDSRELLLQMDIETHEWLSLLNTSIDTLSRFRIMVIEFHSLPLVRLPYVHERVYSPVIVKLLKQFDIVHVHPNNSVGVFTHGRNLYPDTLEVTFHRKDRRRSLIKLNSTKHAMDSPCDPTIQELNLDSMLFDIS